MPVQYVPDATGSTARPGLISGLGVLSFINTGFFLLVYAIGWLIFSAIGDMPFEEYQAKVSEALKELPPGMGSEDLAGMEQLAGIMHGSGALLMGLFLLRTLIRLFGTLGLWRAKRWGFYTYATAQIGGIFLPLVVLPASMIGVLGPLLAVGMVAAFGSQLKRLH